MNNNHLDKPYSLKTSYVCFSITDKLFTAWLSTYSHKIKLMHAMIMALLFSEHIGLFVCSILFHFHYMHDIMSR